MLQPQQQHIAFPMQTGKVHAWDVPSQESRKIDTLVDCFFCHSTTATHHAPLLRQYYSNKRVHFLKAHILAS